MSVSAKTVIYKGNQDIVGENERDGTFQIKGFFDRSAVHKAREEMVALLDRDIKERRDRNVVRPVHMEQGKFQTTLTNMMHTRLFPTWESPTYAAMIAEMFEAPIIQDFMAKTVGENFRLRVDLIRRSTGVNDTVDEFQVPHEWHRDTPGEFTFGFYFDDILEAGSGGTCVIPGTHWEKLDPRWDLLLSENGRPLREDFLNSKFKVMPKGYFERAPLNQNVRQDLVGKVKENLGEAGDLYFFLNDTWHGRFPNRSGRKVVLGRCGGFPTDFEFKDDIPLPAGISVLPETLQRLYRADQPVNSDKSVLVHRLLDRGVRFVEWEKAAAEKRALATEAKKAFDKQNAA